MLPLSDLGKLKDKRSPITNDAMKKGIGKLCRLTFILMAGKMGRLEMLHYLKEV